MYNLHFLELFYYVARWGGVSEAVRKMPYSVQQPSMSRQLKELEQQAGAILFQRRPFQLTLGGEKLFGVVKRFFDELHGVDEEIRAGVSELVRIGASPIVLRDYLPPLLSELERTFPGMRFTLREGLQSQIAQWFENRQVDLAVTMLDSELLPRGCQSETLLRLPMVLLVPAGSRYRSAEQVWRQGQIQERVISPQPLDAVTRCFGQGLKRRSVRWDIGIEVNSIELVEAYVSHGFGVGVSITVPGRAVPAGLRALPLAGFPRIQIGMIWQRQPSKGTEALMAALRKRARQMRGVS